jgi:hypothetical protein
MNRKVLPKLSIIFLTSCRRAVTNNQAAGIELFMALLEKQMVVFGSEADYSERKMKIICAGDVQFYQSRLSGN